ncbi:MAG: IS91 family transposase [Desulfovibrionales bacterium]|jgi:predicted Zn-ribbon and HTH transcriptional regulator|nr:IS91 family transposase [Desulfovibrionales bacterium]
MENKRQKIEIADIFRRFEPEYYQKHDMIREQQKVFNDIINCRSQNMGGHTLKCDTCGYVQHAYNSCRNRHCPKCQYLKQVVWVDKLKARLLPVKYFHIVFTVPSALHKLFYTNQGICYDLLMKSASQAVIKAGDNPAFLGAKTGCVAILHTWGQALTYHPHVHLLVPAGGFDSDMLEWRQSKGDFFAPVKALSSLFRGIFARNIYKHAEDLIPDRDGEKTDIDFLRKLIYEANWNVFAKPALKNAENVIEYLGRYTHRVAISNARILEIAGNKVHFVWKDYKQNGRTKVMKLEAVEFISRFMLHVLPNGFYKIRYYGIFANIHCNDVLDTYLSLENKEMVLSLTEGKVWQDIVEEVLGYDPFRCKKCKKGKMLIYEKIDAKPRAA